MDKRSHTRPAKTLAGDIVVSRVARHYALGRLHADLRTQMPIEAQDHRADALRRACVLAGADRRVFLHELAGPCDYVHIVCSEVVEPEKLNGVVHGERRLKPRTR